MRNAYEDRLSIIHESIKTDRQLFGDSGSGKLKVGWVTGDNVTTLTTICRGTIEGVYAYPNVVVSVMHKITTDCSAGDIYLQGVFFGNLAEPNVIRKLKKKITTETRDHAMNAKVKYELPKC